MTQTTGDSHGELGIASLLSASYHSLIHRIVSELNSAGFTRLSGNQLHLISRIPEEAISVEDLSEKVGIPSQLVSNLVSTAVSSGYLRDEDGMVELTDRGEEAMRIVGEAQRKMEKEWEASIGVSDYAELRSQLIRLFEVTGGAHSDS